MISNILKIKSSLITLVCLSAKVGLSQSQSQSQSRKVDQVAIGVTHTCVLFEDHGVKCWGDNSYGQLGYGNNQSIVSELELGENLNDIAFQDSEIPQKVTAGLNFTCVMFTSGAVKCWGDGSEGRLGYAAEDTLGATPESIPSQLPKVPLGSNLKAVDLASGLDHTCAVLDNGRIRCWGSNSRGQLGTNNPWNRGDLPDTSGDNIPFVDLGQNALAIRVFAGEERTCTELSTGALKCWGRNYSGIDRGTLGIGLPELGEIGRRRRDVGEQLPQVNLGGNLSIKDVSIALNHQCVLFENGKAKCWGVNSFGQLALGDNRNRLHPSLDMGDRLTFLDTGNIPITSIVANSDIGYRFTSFSTCFSLANATVKCFGGGRVNSLGNETTENIGDSSDEVGDMIPAVNLGSNSYIKKVLGGYAKNCALYENGLMKCWGSNNFGELGLGYQSSNIVGDEPGEMGENLRFTLAQ